MTYSLYLGDCLEYMKSMPDKSVDAVITDPPYGIGIKANYAERGRGALAECNNFKQIIGDNIPFNPSPFLSYPTVVMFGSDHYYEKLSGGSWHVWDKLDGLVSDREVGFNDNSDCEFIWCNQLGATRLFRHRWMGAMKKSEQQERRIHPTQKPVSLMMQIIKYFTNPTDTIFDPFMGSGTTGVAAIQLGRNFIGCEIVPTYYAIAEKRIKEATLQPLLFTSKPIEETQEGLL